MPINVIVKTQSNRLIDRKVNEFRSRLGNAMIPMQHAVREALTVLREGGCVALAADQSAARESVWTEFFGRPVPTHQGPAVFTLRTGSMLVAAVAERQADGSYRMRFEEIPSSDLAPDDPSSILELTRRHVRWTEEVIRRNPAQWMWMHRRWKHALPGVETGEAA
jgi:KDO2-lipid IV(A) lauroyltransferase